LVAFVVFAVASLVATFVYVKRARAAQEAEGPMDAWAFASHVECAAPSNDERTAPRVVYVPVFIDRVSPAPAPRVQPPAPRAKNDPTAKVGARPKVDTRTLGAVRANGRPTTSGSTGPIVVDAPMVSGQWT
jgi:hypothetical protein